MLDLSKLNEFAYGKMNVTQKLKFVWERVENTVRKGENAGYEHFLLFSHCFQKSFFSRVMETWNSVVNFSTVTKQTLDLTSPWEKAFENIVGNEKKMLFTSIFLVFENVFFILTGKKSCFTCHSTCRLQVF